VSACAIVWNVPRLGEVRTEAAFLWLACLWLQCSMLLLCCLRCAWVSLAHLQYLFNMLRFFNAL
jgi:hypothetical protein